MLEGMAEHSRLVGRASESGRVMAAVRQAADGRPAVVVMSGDAGIGKTRLVEEVVGRAAEDGFLTAVGQCSPMRGTRLPYAPVIHLIRDVLRQFPDIEWSIPGEAWRGVAPLLGLDAPVETLDQQIAAARLFAGVVEVLAAVSRRQPALLVVEDMHWTDAATSDLLGFVARALRHNRLALLLTLRSTSGSSHTPSEWLAELMRLPGTVSVPLGPLADRDIVELLDQLPVRLTPAVLRRVSQVAEGSPFFAEHLAMHGADGAIPPHVRSILMSFLADLTELERTLAILLTVLGDREDTNLLVGGIGAPIEEFNRAARGLRDRGVVVARNGSIGFSHALMREVVVDDTLPGEKMRAHEQAADAMLASPAGVTPDRAAALAHHLQQCGRYPDALRYAVRAARRAGSMWAFADASFWYGTSVRLWQLVENPSAAAGVGHAALLRESAIAARWNGNFDEATELLDQAYRRADLTSDERAAIDQARGQVLWGSGDMGAALQAYQRSANLVTDDTSLRAATLAALAHGLMATGRSQEAASTAREAIDQASLVGADRVRLHAEITAAATKAQLGDVDSAVEDLRRCLPLVRALDDIELTFRCYGNLTFALGLSCRYKELAAIAAEGVDACGRYGPVISLASSLRNNQVTALVQLGRWDEAEQLAHQALQDPAAIGITLLLRTLLAEVAVARGDDAEAASNIAVAEGLGSDDPYARSALSVIRADRALWDSKPHVAAEIVAEVLPELLAQDDARLVLDACWRGLRAAADIAATAGKLSREGGTDPNPAPLLGIARAAWVTTGLPLADAIFRMCEAESARMIMEDSASQWSEVGAANETLSLPYFQAYCLMRSGAAELRRGARVPAQQVLTRAFRIAMNLQARPLAAEIRMLSVLGNLSLEPPPADEIPERATPLSTPDNFRLTRREKQVLALLTTGATNRLIARRLYISERTASVHVSNILAKLGVVNRTEAARMALTLKLGTIPPIAGD